jgi:hypothetical protein
MINKDTIVSMLLLIAGAFVGYFLVKERDYVPKSVPQDRQAVEETIEFVSILDKIHPDEIAALSSEAVEWPNSCLGLPMPGEICAEALVPGYRITLDADGEKMIFRTNKDGSSIRRDMAAER